LPFVFVVGTTGYFTSRFVFFYAPLFFFFQESERFQQQSHHSKNGSSTSIHKNLGLGNHTQNPMDPRFNSTSVNDAHSFTKTIGNLSSINISYGSLALTIIIASVLWFEHLFEKIKNMTHDTQFQGMVGAIERELMVGGFIAFVFRLFSGNMHMSEVWHISFEFSGMMINFIKTL
jgi:hypothetical protein